MAFTVEDGTGLENATSYISVAFADDYHADRGSTQWAAATSGNRQIALIKATDFIDKRFGRRFVGLKLTKLQALEWPRSSAYDRDGYAYNDEDVIPRALQKATAEYALRALAILNLLPDPQLQFSDRNTTAATGSLQSGGVTGQLKRSRVKAAVVETDKTYTTFADVEEQTGETRRTGTLDVPSFVIPVYPAADLLLVELLNPIGSVIRA